MSNLITLNSPTSSLSNSTPSLNRPVLSRLQLKTEKARRRLREFVEQAWPVIEPKPFVPRMHVDAICLHLQAVTEGRIGGSDHQCASRSRQEFVDVCSGQPGCGSTIRRFVSCSAPIAQ